MEEGERDGKLHEITLAKHFFGKIFFLDWVKQSNDVQQLFFQQVLYGEYENNDTHYCICLDLFRKLPFS